MKIENLTLIEKLILIRLMIERGLDPARANAYGKKLHASICGGSRIDVQRIVNSFFPAPIMPVDEEKLGSVFQKVPEAE